MVSLTVFAFKSISNLVRKLGSSLKKNIYKLTAEIEHLHKDDLFGLLADERLNVHKPTCLSARKHK